MQTLARWLGILVLVLGIVAVVFGVLFMGEAADMKGIAAAHYEHLKSNVMPGVKAGVEEAKIGEFGASMGAQAGEAMPIEAGERWDAAKGRLAEMEGVLMGVEEALKGISAIDSGVAANLAGDVRALPVTPEGAYLMASVGTLRGAVNAARGEVAAAEGQIYAAMGAASGTAGSWGAAKGILALSEGMVSSVTRTMEVDQMDMERADLLKMLGIVDVILGAALIVAGAGQFLLSRRLAA